MTSQPGDTDRPRGRQRQGLHDPAVRPGVPRPPGDLEGPPITGIKQDSRRITAGEIYAALPEAGFYGATFAAEAAARGATGAISDRPGAPLRTFVVENPRRVLVPHASWLHGDPFCNLDDFGVTGTNGKTSTAYRLSAGLHGAGKENGLISSAARGARDPPYARPRRAAGELQRTLAGSTFARPARSRWKYPATHSRCTR